MALLRDSFNVDVQMAAVYNLGKALIGTDASLTAAYTAIQSALALNAASGIKEFTVNVAHNGLNSAIELRGLYWQTYSAGIISALAEQHIYSYEVTPSVNLTVRDLASIDLKFSF